MPMASVQRHSRNKIGDISISSDGAVSDRKIFLKSNSKCLNAIPKSIKKRASSIDSLKPYLLPDANLLPVDTIKRTGLLLPYKSYEKEQSKERFLKKLDIKVYERYKMCNTQIIKKLQEIDNALNDVCAVTNYDEEFFKIVNGRPLFHHIPLYKSLNTSLNGLLRIRQEAGYKNDCILNIEMNFRKEKKTYDLSLQRLTEQAKAFDRYIMEDYEKSMKVLQEGEKLNAKLEAKISELQNIADKSFVTMSRLIGLDYKYGIQQKYGRFLYYLSPPLWRANNREFAQSVEIEAKGFDYGSSNVDDTFTVMFENMRKQCLSSFIKPVLYFEHPHDLIDVFNGMEKQQLYHFSRQMQVSPHTKSLKEGIQILKEKNALDSTSVTASITAFKNLLTFCEERNNQLKEQFFKVLNGCFYESVGTPEVLKLMVHLEFCFDNVFGEKPMNMDILTMAKAIESMYFSYTERLDAIQGQTVRRAMKRCIELENQKTVKAKSAAKELRLFYRLERELLRAHNFVLPEMNVPRKNKEKPHLKRNRSKPRICSERQKPWSDAELEYLTLFTDWTKDENPALYLQSVKTG